MIARAALGLALASCVAVAPRPMPSMDAPPPPAPKPKPAPQPPAPKPADDREGEAALDPNAEVTVAWGNGGLMWKVPASWQCADDQGVYVCASDPARKDLVGRFAVAVVAATAVPPPKLFADADRNLDRGVAQSTVLGTQGELHRWDYCVPKDACLPTTTGSSTSTRWTAVVTFGPAKKRVIVETRCGSKDDCDALPKMIESLVRI